jgi:hypothetical protein
LLLCSITAWLLRLTHFAGAQHHRLRWPAKVFDEFFEEGV